MDVHVFISYSHAGEDKRAATAFARRLEKNGIDCFLDDRSIQYGEHIGKRVEEALRRASHVVAFLSPGAESSQWVFFEVGIAFALGKVIVLRLLHSRQKVPLFVSAAKYMTSVKDEEKFIRYLKDAKGVTRGRFDRLEKGFGHVVPDAGEPLIFKENDLLLPRRLAELKKGDILEFERELGERVRRARRVRRVAKGASLTLQSSE